MTREQISLVQKSFDMVPAETAADLFYARLFELDPSLRPLFKGDMKAQGAKLMGMIAVAVQGLSNLDRIVPAVQDLGVRHAGYSVTPDHYDTVGAALLWTLEKGLGEQFTDDVREAWTAAYILLSSTMLDAAERKAA
jgi:hemoglobin-like flavoprotein